MIVSTQLVLIKTLSYIPRERFLKTIISAVTWEKGTLTMLVSGQQRNGRVLLYTVPTEIKSKFLRCVM